MPGESRTILADRWHPAIVAAVFFLIQFAATAIGSALLVARPSASAFWPAGGTLIAALLLFPRRVWPWLLASGFLAGYLADADAYQIYASRIAFLIALVNMGQGALAAELIRRFVGPRVDFANARATTRLLLLLLVASFVGGLAGAAVLGTSRTSADFWINQQTWWLSGFLGAVVLVPLILSWAGEGVRAPPGPLRPAPWLMPLQFAVLALVLWHVFSDGDRFGLAVFDSPFLVYLALLWIVWSGGARRVTLALLFVSVTSIGYTLIGHGPFSGAGSAPFGSILNLQAFLVLVVVPLLVAQASITEKRQALGRVRESDGRYRAFVEHSSEAIFRFELSQPMPVTLAASEQRLWLGKHAYVAEANDAFRTAAGNGTPGELVAQHPVWLEHCLATVPDAIAAGGRMQNVECVLPGPYGLDRTLLVSLSTELAHGALERIWGVARDITHFRAVQRQLEQQQRELRALATELTVTEERARRKIAADLHDGLAQSLVGLKLHIAAIRLAAEQGRPLPDLAALELTISESTAQVRTLMTSLLPPGLYDQGIVAGLTWLADDFAKRQRIEVAFEDDGQPKPLAESTIVLVYQAARQLLQNVARHARATAVTIRLQAVGDRLQLTVTDGGVGFNVSDLTFLPTQQGGFGLYSIRERLTIIGGSLEIDSAPGRGTRVLVTAPLRTPAHERSRAQGAVQ
ncbi:MAG: MASE1 domain-containing protein [Steroidobacteraceae bacterium]